MTTQYGAPLTGEQMKLLRAAGLPDGTVIRAWQGDHSVTLPLSRCSCSSWIPYSLPTDHAAYTLLEAGWLDGRNVALWFGGEKAPDDWDKQFNGGEVLLRSGEMGHPITYNHWMHLSSHPQNDIIAYTRKAEIEYPPANEKLKEAVRLSREITAQPETVTIAKMTPSEVKAKFDRGVQPLVDLHRLGLIKPEQTRLERFWGSKCREGELWEDIVKEALEFER